MRATLVPPQKKAFGREFACPTGVESHTIRFSFFVFFFSFPPPFLPSTLLPSFLPSSFYSIPSGNDYMGYLLLPSPIFFFFFNSLFFPYTHNFILFLTQFGLVWFFFLFYIYLLFLFIHFVSLLILVGLFTFYFLLSILVFVYFTGWFFFFFFYSISISIYIYIYSDYFFIIIIINIRFSLTFNSSQFFCPILTTKVLL